METLESTKGKLKTYEIIDGIIKDINGNIGSLNINSIDEFIKVTLEKVELLPEDSQVKKDIVRVLNKISAIHEKYNIIKDIREKISKTDNPLEAIKIIIESDLIKKETIDDIKGLITYLDKQANEMDNNNALKPVAQLGVTSIKLMVELVKDGADITSINSVKEAIKLILATDAVGSDSLKQLKQVVVTLKDLVGKIDDKGIEDINKFKSDTIKTLGLIEFALDLKINSEIDNELKAMVEYYKPNVIAKLKILNEKKATLNKHLEYIESLSDSLYNEINKEEPDQSIITQYEEDIKEYENNISESNLALKNALEAFEDSIDNINNDKVEEKLKNDSDINFNDNYSIADRKIKEVNAKLEGKAVIKGSVSNTLNDSITNMDTKIQSIVNPILQKINDIGINISYDQLKEAIGLGNIYSHLQLKSAVEVYRIDTNNANTSSQKVDIDYDGQYTLELEPGLYELKFEDAGETTEYKTARYEEVIKKVRITQWKECNLDITMEYPNAYAVIVKPLDKLFDINTYSIKSNNMNEQYIPFENLIPGVVDWPISIKELPEDEYEFKFMKKQWIGGYEQIGNSINKKLDKGNFYIID